MSFFLVEKKMHWTKLRTYRQHTLIISTFSKISMRVHLVTRADDSDRLFVGQYMINIFEKNYPEQRLFNPSKIVKKINKHVWFGANHSFFHTFKFHFFWKNEWTGLIVLNGLMVAVFFVFFSFFFTLLVILFVVITI